MGFFTVGNIITLGIVLLILILYRQMDRGNRTLKLLRDYSEKLKKDLGDFVKEQERTVKDYAISLNVERDAGKELMKRLQQTEEELAEKAQAMDRIDSQINAYESSLAELERMTSRVQENMNRVRDESAFVDATGKRISEVKDKLAEFEKGLADVEKKYERELGDIERKFEKENADSLEKAADSVMAAIKFTVSDLRAAEETIERKVEEHRLAVVKIEEARAANLARDTEYINKLLAKAVEQAGKRADKMEEAALANLKEQAEDRIHKLKTAEEERLRSYQESARARIIEVQALVKNFREEWRTERSEWESRDKVIRDERKKDLEFFAANFGAAKKQVEDFSVRVNEIISSQETLLFKAAEEIKQNLVKNFREEWRTERSEWENKDKAIRDERKKDLEFFAANFGAAKKQVEDFSVRVNEIISSQETLLFKAAEEIKQNLVKNFREEWRTERSEWESRDKAIRDERKKDMEVFTLKFDASKKQIEDFSVRANEIVSSQEALLIKAAEEMKQKALEVNDAKLEEYRRAQDVEFRRLETLADDSRKLDAELRQYMQELIGRLKDEFSGYQGEAEELRKVEAENFSSTAAHLKGEMTEFEKGLAALKSASYDNISEKLKTFENEFFADLDKRNNDINQRIEELQGILEGRLSVIGENVESTAAHLKGEVVELEKGLAALKSASYDNISEKLKTFENEFSADLAKRSNDIDLRIVEWQGSLEGRLSAIGENSETTLREMEHDRAEDMKKNLFALDARLVSELKRLKSETDAFEDGILAQMKAAEEMKQKALEDNGARLEEYRRAQDVEFRRLETLADDSRKLDAELRRYMQELIGRLKDEFSGYQREAGELRKAETENFSSTAAHLKGEMTEFEKGLAALKSASYDNISEKLKTFENEFFADLAKRSNDIDLRIVEWQGSLEGRLSAIGENNETALREMEHDRAEDMKKNLFALDARLVSELERLKSETDAFEDGILAQMKAAEEMKQKALEDNGARLEEYRRAQDVEFRRLETLADDSRKLDAELRQYIQELIGRLKDEFSGYQGEAEELRKAETENFSLTAAHLKGEMTEFEKGLAALKSASYDNISEKLKTFENEFFTDLAKRSNDIDLRIVEWQGSLEGRLSAIGENNETALREMEHDRAEDMKKNLFALDARLVSELEHLKSETDAFEDGILAQMKAADDSVSSFKEQLDSGLEDARKEAEISIKSEIGNYSITASETVKKYQRELDDAWSGLSAKLGELDNNVEEARRRIRDLAAETDSRIALVRSSVEDAERHIREAVDQTRLIDKADTMRLEMERRIEDLRGDIDRLDQRRAEAAKLENEFVKIKRHEDDINAKMIKIFSEERRIENMEANFTRFLQISRSVEEKLSEVTASNDTLLGVQLQIRKLEEALGNTEEKYQRLERKNHILDNTNDGIDKNFKLLQETEKLSNRIGEELVQYADELERIKISIEKLSSESEKAASTVDRIDVLSDALEEIEERIKSMQRARQWIADAETRLEELNRQAQTQARAIDGIVKGKKSGHTADMDNGTLSEQKKRDILILLEQGWTVDAIAKAMKVSIGVVELVKEFAPKD